LTSADVHLKKKRRSILDIFARDKAKEKQKKVRKREEKGRKEQQTAHQTLR